MKDMTKALATAGNTSSQGMLTLPTNERAANVVPQADASLFVPSKDVDAMFGIRLNRAGSCISPPPPTAASIRPAKKANKHSSEMVSMIGNENGRQRQYRRRGFFWMQLQIAENAISRSA